MDMETKNKIARGRHGHRDLVRHHDAFEQTGGEMSEQNPWRYFRNVGDHAIRRVRQGDKNGSVFYRSGARSESESLSFYLTNSDYKEITEAEAVEILGSCPWEPAPSSATASPVKYIHKQTIITSVTRFSGDSQVTYGGEGRWQHVTETEISEESAAKMLGGKPWEPALTLEPDPQPATPTADQPPPVPSSAFAVQIGGDHYKSLPIQPIEYCQRNGLGAVESFVVKYVTRWRKKGGVEDLRKAVHLLEMLIEMEAKHA